MEKNVSFFFDVFSFLDRSFEVTYVEVRKPCGFEFRGDRVAHLEHVVRIGFESCSELVEPFVTENFTERLMVSQLAHVRQCVIMEVERRLRHGATSRFEKSPEPQHGLLAF